MRYTQKMWTLIMKTINRIKVCTMHPEETYTNENFHFSTFSVFFVFLAFRWTCSTDFFRKWKHSQTCIRQPLLGPLKSGCLWQVVVWDLTSFLFGCHKYLVPHGNNFKKESDGEIRDFATRFFLFAPQNKIYMI